MQTIGRTGGANAANPSPAMTLPAVGRDPQPRAPSVGAGTFGRWKLDTLRTALFLVVFFSIGRMHQHYSVLALFRPALLLVGLATAMALLQPKSLNQAPILKTWPARIVAAIGFMALASTPMGISFGASASFILSDFSKTLLLCILLVAATRNARDLVAFSWAFVLGCAFLVYLSLFFFQVSRVGGGLARLNNLYMYDANDINSILVIGFGLVALLSQTYTGALRYGCIILMLGMGAAIARSGSRGGFLGLVVVGAGLLVTLNRVSIAKRVGFVGLISLGLGLNAPPGYWDQMNTILTPKQDYNWSAEDGRRQIWTRGMGYMMEYPIGGLGIGNFQRAECTIGSKARNHIVGTGLTCIAPHNSYLQIGAEMGFPGLILWLVMIFGGIVKMRALAKRVPRHWERGDFEARFLFQAPRYLTICLAAFALTSFFVSHAYLDPVYILMGLMAGTYTAVAERIRRERPATAPAPLTGSPAAFPPSHGRGKASRR